MSWASVLSAWEEKVAASASRLLDKMKVLLSPSPLRWMNGFSRGILTCSLQQIYIINIFIFKYIEMRCSCTYKSLLWCRYESMLGCWEGRNQWQIGWFWNGRAPMDRRRCSEKLFAGQHQMLQGTDPQLLLCTSHTICNCNMYSSSSFSLSFFWNYNDLIWRI